MARFTDDPENIRKAFTFRVVIEKKLVQIGRGDIDPGKVDGCLKDTGWENCWKLVPVRAKVYWPQGWYGYAEDGHLGPEIVSEVEFHESIVNSMVWLTGLPDHGYNPDFHVRGVSYATCIDPKRNIVGAYWYKFSTEHPTIYAITFRVDLAVGRRIKIDTSASNFKNRIVTVLPNNSRSFAELGLDAQITNPNELELPKIDKQPEEIFVLYGCKSSELKDKIVPFPYLAKIDVGVVWKGWMAPGCNGQDDVCNDARVKRLQRGPATRGTWNPGCILTKTWLYAPSDTGTGLKDWWKSNWSTLLAIGVAIGIVVLFATGAGSAIAGSIAASLGAKGFILAVAKFGIEAAMVGLSLKGASKLIERTSDIAKAKAQEASERIHAYWTCAADRNNAGCERYYNWKPPEDQQKFAEVIEVPGGTWCIPSKDNPQRPLCVKAVGGMKLSFPVAYALLKSIDKEFWALADGKESVLFNYNPTDVLDAYYYLNHLKVVADSFGRIVDAIWNHGFEILPEFWGAWAAVGKDGTEIERGEGIFYTVINAISSAFGGLRTARPPAPPPTFSLAPKSPFAAAPKAETTAPQKPKIGRASMLTLGALAVGGLAFAMLKRRKT